MNLHEESTKRGKVCDELFGLRADFMPYGIKLPAHDRVERAEVGVLDIEVV